MKFFEKLSIKAFFISYLSLSTHLWYYTRISGSYFNSPENIQKTIVWYLIVFLVGFFLIGKVMLSQPQLRNADNADQGYEIEQERYELLLKLTKPIKIAIFVCYGLTLLRYVDVIFELWTPLMQKTVVLDVIGLVIFSIGYYLVFFKLSYPYGHAGKRRKGKSLREKWNSTIE